MVTELSVKPELLAVAKEITDVVLLDSMRKAVLYHLDYDDMSGFNRQLVEDASLSSLMEKISFFKKNSAEIKGFFPEILSTDTSEYEERMLESLISNEQLTSFILKANDRVKELMVVALSSKVTGVFRDFSPYINKRRVNRAVEEWLKYEDVKAWLSSQEYPEHHQNANSNSIEQETEPKAIAG